MQNDEEIDAEMIRIELKGEPYVRNGFSKQQVRTALAAKEYDLDRILEEPENKRIVSQLGEIPLRDLNIKIKESEDLTFDESFLGMCYVLAATNPQIYDKFRPLIEKAQKHDPKKMPEDGRSFDRDKSLAMGTSYLEGMAFKESYLGLTHEELAGMTAATLMDVIYRVPLEEAIDTCGMGGDKGFMVNGEKRKTINASTLSGIVLASLGKPAFKHGSYSNTSAVGSTEAIEELGANINSDDPERIREIMEETNFYFTDAHLFKTVHDLSHLLKFETVNHVIGPMTTPVSKDTLLHRVLGVNHKIHPRDVAQAYELLHEKKIQKVGNVLVVSGLSQDYRELTTDFNSHEELKPHMLLDEISPYTTLIGIVQNGKYVGCSLITPEDFGISVDVQGIQLRNEEDVMNAMNLKALKGEDQANADYLAMNAALGLFTIEYLGREDAIVDGQLNRSYLQESFTRCRTAISEGTAYKALEKFITSTQR